jgi:hypothetical protein
MSVISGKIIFECPLLSLKKFNGCPSVYCYTCNTLFPFSVNISFIYMFINNYLVFGSRNAVVLATSIPNNLKCVSEEFIEDSQK